MSTVQVQKLHTLTGHRDCIYTLQKSSDPACFFSASGDGMVVRWDLNDPSNGELIAKLPNSVYSLSHHPSSGLLIAAQNYEGVHFLDWQNKTEKASLQITKAAIFDMQVAGDRLLLACGDGSLVVVDPEKLVIEKRIKLSEKSARTIAIDPASGDVAIGFSDNFIRIVDENFELKAEWRGHNNSVFTLRYMPDTQLLLSGSRDARLKVWEKNNGYAQAAEVVAHMYAINHIEFSPDGKHFVTCSMDKSIKVWDAAALKLLKVIDRARHAGHATSVNKLLWTRYDQQLLSASDDRSISVWQIIF